MDGGVNTERHKKYISARNMRHDYFEIKAISIKK